MKKRCALKRMTTSPMGKKRQKENYCEKKRKLKKNEK
jgi:hypothetical protein